jgi:LmbE family N-acetylglucosaminyl deacetylase
MKNPEHVLLPFQASELPPGPWLVFAPHADDETFGMGGSLLKAAAEGIATHVVVMTDGALGGTAADLVTTRQHEVQEATRLLGVTSLHCWREPDRGLQFSDRLVEKIIALIKELQPVSVFFPAVLEPHPDHRTTALLVWQGLRRLRRRREAPQPYAYEITAQSPVNRLIDTTAHKAAKETVMAVYSSQNSETDYPALVLALDKARTFTLPGDMVLAEGFYCYAPEDLEHSLWEVSRGIVKRYFD